MENYVINIGRELGSGGRVIGKILAERRKISYYDKELLAVAAKESGLSKEFFEKADEITNNNVGKGLFGFRFPFYPSDMNDNNPLCNNSLFKIQSDIVRELAQKQSCLFVGRCTDYILRDFPRCVNVFVSATKEDRINSIMKNYQLSVEKAEEMIQKVDKKRSEFYNYYSMHTWGAAKTYHLCINSSVLGIERTADFIDEFVKLKLGEL